jgi:signal peptidase I
MKLRKWILTSVLCGMLMGCNNSYSSGDRVLVSKFPYDNGFTHPDRYQVVVFKYPGRWGMHGLDGGPMENNTPKNYIKRLLGLPGELLAIFFGRIYRWTPPRNAPPPFDDLKDGNVDAKDLWHKEPFMHIDDKTSREWFEDGQFEILRKSPRTMLAMRRIVYDNDYQAKDLKGKADRWRLDPKSSWKSDSRTGFIHEGKPDGEVDWLTYQHLVRRGDDDVPKVEQLITDSMAYNNINDRTSNPHWVGDLMIECNVEVVEPKGEIWFELNKGIYRYQARWDLASGHCSLKSLDAKGNEKDLGSQATSVKGPGNYMLRFANIDARLTVWVDRTLPFGDGKDYDPPEVHAKHEKGVDIEARRGPIDNDLKPASIGSKGAHVKITHVRLWRDTYYTNAPATSNRTKDYDTAPETWSDPRHWETLRKQHFVTMYVQPGHYLCLGDNSQASADSRDWGLVPERLMLGRALVVYFPLDRIGPIR